MRTTANIHNSKKPHLLYTLHTHTLIRRGGREEVGISTSYHTHHSRDLHGGVGTRVKHFVSETTQYKSKSVQIDDRRAGVLGNRGGVQQLIVDNVPSYHVQLRHLSKQHLKRLIVESLCSYSVRSSLSERIFASECHPYSTSLRFKCISRFVICSEMSDVLLPHTFHIN